MKTTNRIKKSLLIGAAIVSLGASTAFAATSFPVNNPNVNNGPHMKQGPKAIYRESKISPIQTLAKILGEYPSVIIEDAHKDFLDVYQYASKKGVLAKYKAERMLLAKENIQQAVDHKRITKAEGNKVLAKVQSNINSEKPESMGILPPHHFKQPKPMNHEGHGPLNFEEPNEDMK